MFNVIKNLRGINFYVPFAGHKRLIPGISERDCIAEFAGLRAVAPDDDFVIGLTSVPGFINVAGIQSPGLTAAPAIAEDVVALLASAGLDLSPRSDLRPAAPRPVRVSELDRSDLEMLVFRDRRYAHIVCRCEMVTEGEIADAIGRGARTLDGVKFRTRARLGACSCWPTPTTVASPRSRNAARGPGSCVSVRT